MNIIRRQTYIDRIEHLIGKETIIVLTGQRRVGKSYLLKTIAEMKAKLTDSNIIYIDKEKSTFDFIKTYEDLNAYIQNAYRPDLHNYIFIDEVQEIKEFERSVRNWRTEPNTDLIITGSNAEIMSSTLSTMIGGRYTEVYVQSLSYLEFLDFYALQDSDDSLRKYIDYGGLPGLIKLGIEHPEDIFGYQMNVFNTVLLKDVIMRHEIRNAPFLMNLVIFIADNVGKQISAGSIGKYMRSQEQSVTIPLILNYLSYLCDAYIIARADRYDIHGKKLFDSNAKYYFEDHGLRNALVGGRRDSDIEKVIENVIYRQLIYLGYDVKVGQLQVGEVDFVCAKPGASPLYIQASFIVADEQTRLREFGRLKEIQDNYPKYVISMTPLVDRTDEDGIIHLSLRRFLTKGFAD